MRFDFFQESCSSVSSKKIFGLCDDTPPPSKPAYIKEEEGEAWIGVVNNSSELECTFHAIDNCVELRDYENQLESTCDGLLEFENNLIFIELKEARSSGWFQKGVSQIKNTILLFKKEQNIEDWNSVSAYICNSQFPKANVQRSSSLEKFKDETGIILKDERFITI